MLNIYRDTDTLLAADKKDKKAVGIVKNKKGTYYSLYTLNGNNYSYKAINHDILYGKDTLLLFGLIKINNHHLSFNYNVRDEKSHLKKNLVTVSGMLTDVLNQLGYSVMDCTISPNL